MAQQAGLDEVTTGILALVVTELATNLTKHTDGGELLVRRLGMGNQSGIEILSLDKGPGIRDIGRSLGDGFSTAGSPGTGLGAVHRASSSFDIYSQPGKGTAVVARILTSRLDGSQENAQLVGVVHQAKHGETLCGDDWLVQSFADGWLCAVVDGLGHGLVAAEAATPIMESMRTAHGRRTPMQLIEDAHYAARATRGAALAVAVVDGPKRLLRFAGIGNISGVIIENDRRRHLVSYNGIVGHRYATLSEFTYPWSKGALLILHSDGIGTQWDLSAYPGLHTRDPSLVAGVLFRDFTRHRDDSTLVVVRDS